MRSPARQFLSVALTVVVVGVWQQAAWSQSPRLPEEARAAAGSTILSEELLDSLTPLDRQILEFVNESQLDELLEGTDPSEIYLSNGDTLAELAQRTQSRSSRNLVFAPLPPCRLLDTRRTSEGALLAGETRGFLVRSSSEGYAGQGGSPDGCGLPGLAGVTLRTNTVRAVALNVMTVDITGPGSLAIWQANRSEPEIGSVSFLGGPQAGGVTSGVLVPVCDEAGLSPCRSGDLKLKAKISGTHVVADVVGYFHAPGEARSDGRAERDEPTEDGPAKRAGADRAREARSAPAPIRTAGRGTTSASPVEIVEGGGRRGALSRDRPRSSTFEATSEWAPDHMLPVEDLSDASATSVRGGVGEYEIALRGQLATGHGAGASVYGYLVNDGFHFDAAAVRGDATTGNAVHGTADNGRAVYGQTRDGYAVYGFDGGSEANRGYAGYFYSTNGIGVYGYSNGNRTHPNIYAPGVYGQSNRGVGVYGRGDTSDSYTFYNEGGYFEGGKGLYARGTDPSGEAGYGARIFSNSYRGMLVQGSGTFYDAYFGGNGGISTNTITVRSTRSTLAVNQGPEGIAPGDLVALVGVVASPDEGQPMLAVARVDAGNRDAVIGVAAQAFETRRTTQPDADETTDFSPVAGAAAPNTVLSIVTEGLAPEVNLDALGRSRAWRVGERIELSADGSLRASSGESQGVGIGRVAGQPDLQKGTIALFLNID